MKAKESFLPQSMRSLFHKIYIYLIGICVVCVSLWLIVALIFYNSDLSGFGTFGTFGEHYYTGKIIGFIKYVIGFIPELFLFMCLGRFGLSLLSSNITKESAPEYNFLRGFVALCFGVSGLGLISKSGCWGGYAGAVVYADIWSLIPKFVLPIGILFTILFGFLSAKLLHIKLSHLIAISKTVWNITKWVLSVFHLTTPPENIISKPDEVEDIVPEKIIKPLRRRKKRNTEIEQTALSDVEYELPPPELLEKSDFGKNVVTPEFKQTAILLQEHFEEYNIFGKVVGIKPGPIVTQYEFEREPGTRVAKFEELSRDMALAMGTEKIRISPISGTIYIGIEMRNRQPQTIKYQTIISNPSFVDSKFSIPLALGVNISGEPMYYDLAKMPHMLIAGRTGSGKSVFVQSLITSIVYHFTPDKCKMIIIDPKAVDFAVWNNIPHLVTPVVTDATESINALKWSVRDMEERYKKLQKMGVRNIGEYNEKVAYLRESGQTLTEQVIVGEDPETGEKEFETREIDLSDMPYLIIFVDEVADLMTVARKDVELCVQRLAQKSRAAGIHLVLATQRPSADVITGVIKANFPGRISFAATSIIDSMTTLGAKGAEQLLPCGDMLFNEGGRIPVRIHSAYISNEEIKRVADFLRSQGEADYIEGVTTEENTESVGAYIPSPADAKAAKNADIYEQAKEIVINDKKPTISYIQRRLQIGYNKAASIIERMEQEGIISTPDPSGKRHIL